MRTNRFMYQTIFALVLPLIGILFTLFPPTSVIGKSICLLVFVIIAFMGIIFYWINNRKEKEWERQFRKKWEPKIKKGVDYKGIIITVGLSSMDHKTKKVDVKKSVEWITLEKVDFTYICFITTGASDTYAKEIGEKFGLKEHINVKYIPTNMDDISSTTSASKEAYNWLDSKGIHYMNIVLAPTGGTSIMSMGLSNLAMAKNLDIIYIKSKIDENEDHIEGKQQLVLLQ